MKMNRIDARFKFLKQKKQKAFIVFLTAGFPSLTVTEKLVLELAKIGVDIIELGVPFSDPLADGPTIQAASTYALNKGVTLERVFNLVKKIRRRTEIPLALMIYYNLILQSGIKNFVKACKEIGIDGLIVPDLPVEESRELFKEAKAKQISTVSFLSPTSGTPRIKLVDKVASGFIYYVSLTGVTGARSRLPADLKSQVLKIKRFSKKPVCVGFGVSKSEQVKEINQFSDGVIVGSVLIKLIDKHKNNIPEIIKQVSRLIKQLCIKKPS